ncbi:MAG: sodium:solute symporter family transporter, partial [Hyphomicrobiaceae bacterium]
PAQITKPFIEAFGSMSPTGFVVTALVIMAGIASMPALLVRSGTTRSVYDMRKSMGWTVFFVGLIMIGLPAIAVFFRFILLDTAVGAPNDEIPAWFRTLAASGFVTVDTNSASLSLESIRFARDGVLAGFSIAAGMPTALFFLTIAAALAAAMAAITANTLVLANMLTDDVIFGAGKLPAANFPRLVAARMFVSVAVVAGGVLSLQTSADPLRMFCWGLSLSAAAIFPVLVMSIWWKRITGTAALIGMLTGFSITLLYIYSLQTSTISPLFGVDDMLAAAIGLPLGAAITVAVSLLGPQPQNALLEFVRDLRIPGGETIYDRELRIALNRAREQR